MVRDSAGVRIVENTEPAWAPGEGWRLTDEPVLRIGVVDGDENYQFFRAAGAKRLRDGRIVVLNSGTQQLRFYDSTGRFIRAVGGKGAGPGEFENPFNLYVLPADSLVVFDWTHRRASYFDADGRFLGSVTLRVDGPSPPNMFGRFADGRIAAQYGWSSARDPVDMQTGIYRDPDMLVAYAPDGDTADTLGAFPGAERLVIVQDQSRLYTSPPFARLRYQWVQDDAFLVADSDRYEIGVYGADGALRMLVRRSVEPVPVTEDHIGRYREQQLENARSNPSWLESTNRILEATRYPSTFPAFAGLRVDRADNIWTVAYRLPGTEGPARWTVFDRDGIMLGDVEVPRRFSIRDIGPDYVLGVWRDDLDVEHVLLFGLEKPGQRDAA